MSWKNTMMSAALVAALAGCGPLTYTVRGTPMATGADAIVTADVNKDLAMTTLGIVATNLPPPDRVASGTAHYVAWQRPDADGTWARIGALKYDEGSREGKLEGVTVPNQHFELIVTAESSLDGASPSASVVLSQQVN